jgi:NAD(P)-dependent dehydrogenase (short-subunit alcohol dehydrogenase family)
LATAPASESENIRIAPASFVASAGPSGLFLGLSAPWQGPEEDFDHIFGVNVKCTVFACRQAAKRMADGGRIIHICSSATAMMVPNSIVSLCFGQP